MKIIAHSTLNAIVLSGTREQILEAQALIAQLDVPVDVIGGDTHIETLKNVLAKDLEDTLDRFIQEDISAEQQAAASRRRPAECAARARPLSSRTRSPTVC